MIWGIKRYAIIVLLVSSAGAANAPDHQPTHWAHLTGASVAPSITYCAETTLTGLQEGTQIKAHATGHGMITVSGDGRTLAGKITTDGMQGTSAYIQEGAPGRAGPTIVTLEPVIAGIWDVPRGLSLTPDQYASFIAGNLYMNVASKAYPKGEIRGQLSSINCGVSGETELTPISPAL